jgi:hypothetical protein
MYQQKWSHVCKKKLESSDECKSRKNTFGEVSFGWRARRGCISGATLESYAPLIIAHRTISARSTWVYAMHMKIIFLYFSFNVSASPEQPS